MGAFAKWADSYDVFMALTRLDDVSGVLESVGPVAGLRIVDAGGGTGRLAARLVAAGASVTIVEPEEAMLALARKRCPEATAIDAEFAHSGLPAQSADLVIFRDSLHHMADPVGALDEARRLLVPGGRVVLAEFDARHFLGRLLSAFEALFIQRVAYWTPDGLAHILEAGFCEATVTWSRRHEFVMTAKRD